MRIATFIAILSIVSSIAFSKTIHVPGDFNKIQEAIDASVNGDTVLVHPGTYVENIDFLGKAITVMSSKGAERTVIDGGNPTHADLGSVVTFNRVEGPDSVLCGFTLTKGTGTYVKMFPYSCHVGGGIYCSFYSSPTITDNIIYGNSASIPHGFAGGIYLTGHCSPIIKNNVISGNTADYGGGICCRYTSCPIIMNNTIAGNTAVSYYGGIYCDYNSSAVIINNKIINNSGGDMGGGIHCFYFASPTITNNTIVGNTAASGGGISGTVTSLVLKNNILYNNSASTGTEIWIGFDGSLTISHCDVKGGEASIYIHPTKLNWGAGMIDSEPLFADAANVDFHLTYPSPCKDTGDNSAVTELIDFEGDPRIAYGTVDMGADEFYTHLYWTGDATPGGNVALKFVGLPGTTPVQLWLGSGVLDPPWPTKYGDWYLQFPLLSEVVLGAIPTDGVLVFPCTFPANTPTPLTLPFQAGIGMELTNLSVMEVE